VHDDDAAPLEPEQLEKTRLDAVECRQDVESCQRRAEVGATPARLGRLD
jgi:hypothetical protein